MRYTYTKLSYVNAIAPRKCLLYEIDAVLFNTYNNSYYKKTHMDGDRRG